VTVAVPGAGRLSATAAERRRTIAKGSATATRAGKVTVRVEVTRAGRRALRSRRSHRITVRVTFTAAGAKPTSATRAVTLR
jgi:hypothetical protein